MSLTTDPNDPRLCRGESKGQCETYLVLSEEERKKGFVRPVRRTYLHKGYQVKARGTVKPLSHADKLDHPGYVAIDWFEVSNGKFAGRYLKQKEVDAIASGEFIGGCGCATTMGQALAETYARDPKFYGSTFCICCDTHLPVGEFVWEDGQVVGS